MTNAGIGDQIAGACVVDQLTDVDGDAAVRLLGEVLGSTLLEIAANCRFQ